MCKNYFERKVRGLIIASYPNDYRTYECEVFIPSLKVKVKDEDVDAILASNGRSDYTNVIFTVMNDPIEVELFMKSRTDWYASAREVAQLNLSEDSPLLINGLVKKYKESMVA